MIRLIFILVAVLSCVTTTAQRPTHVDWSTDVELTDAGMCEVRWTADIEPGWHIYAMQLPDLGDTPMPDATSFFIEPEDGIILVGGVEASAVAETHFDEVLKLNLPWWEGKVVFSQKIKIETQTPRITLRGSISYMSCSAQVCTPPTTRPFEITFDNFEATEVESVEPAVEKTPAKSNKNVTDSVADAAQDGADEEIRSTQLNPWLIFGAGFLVGVILMSVIGFFSHRRIKK